MASYRKPRGLVAMPPRPKSDTPSRVKGVCQLDLFVSPLLMLVLLFSTFLQRVFPRIHIAYCRHVTTAGVLAGLDARPSTN